MRDMMAYRAGLAVTASVGLFLHSQFEANELCNEFCRAFNPEHGGIDAQVIGVGCAPSA